MLPWFVFSFFVMACGSTITLRGKTEHESKVSGDVHVVNEIVLRVDVSACENLEGEEQGHCISESVKALGDLVKLAKALSCKDKECLGE